MLVRLEEATGRTGKVHNYLASHPVTGQRIRMFAVKLTVRMELRILEE
jgi:predicted Zn-dependent protease